MVDWLLAYLSPTLGAISSLILLAKEFEEYKAQKHGRLLLMAAYAVLLALLIGGILQTHRSRVQAYNDGQQSVHEKAQATIDRAGLSGQITFAEKQLELLQAKVGDLQTKSDTQAMRKEMAAVRAELTTTQEKLKNPKAHFVATFATQYYNDIPIKQATGERVPEGIRFSVGVLNDSDFTAINPQIALYVCDACSFAVEPAGFERAANGPDNERVRSILNVKEHSVVQDMTIVVVAPINSTILRFGMKIKCENCDAVKMQELTVNIPPLVSPLTLPAKKLGKH